MSPWPVQASGGVDHAVTRGGVEARRQRPGCGPRLEVTRGAVEELRLRTAGDVGVRVVGDDEGPRRAATMSGEATPPTRAGRARGGGRPRREVGARGRGDVPELGARGGDVVGDVAEDHVPLAVGPHKSLVHEGLVLHSRRRLAQDRVVQLRPRHLGVPGADDALVVGADPRGGRAPRRSRDAARVSGGASDRPAQPVSVASDGSPAPRRTCVRRRGPHRDHHVRSDAEPGSRTA